MYSVPNQIASYDVSIFVYRCITQQDASCSSAEHGLLEQKIVDTRIRTEFLKVNSRIFQDHSKLIITNFKEALTTG